jgi:L-seryl-tRNA(Ser) seleniumtransferase
VNALRSLPSVDQVVSELKDLDVPRSLLVGIVRSVIANRRTELLAGNENKSQDVQELVREHLAKLATPSLKPVINATGVILHTNLGRAPLPAFEPISGYSNLEYDLLTGKRGKRDVHISELLQTLLGRPAIAVNNNAAAVFLVLNELAAGSEVIVSRGELIEIGDGFRIPDIMARGGVVLREVGTTNRTHLRDYQAALTPQTRLILRVHPSNFHMSGFTARPDLAELAAFAREHGISLYEDLGSGCLVDLSEFGIHEPLVEDSLKAGANVVSFSCDKLLGGPQAGLIAGDAELIAKIRRNPMYRAFRLDKLSTQALQTSLSHLLMERWNCIPTLGMIRAGTSELRARAERIAAELHGLPIRVAPNASPIGGGSTPDQTLPTWVVEVSVPNPASLERSLRRSTPPVIARIAEDAVLLDMRTVFDEEVPALIASIRSALEMP